MSYANPSPFGKRLGFNVSFVTMLHVLLLIGVIIPFFPRTVFPLYSSSSFLVIFVSLLIFNALIGFLLTYFLKVDIEEAMKTHRWLRWSVHCIDGSVFLFITLFIIVQLVQLLF